MTVSKLMVTYILLCASCPIDVYTPCVSSSRNLVLSVYHLCIILYPPFLVASIWMHRMQDVSRHAMIDPHKIGTHMIKYVYTDYIYIYTHTFIVYT